MSIARPYLVFLGDAPDPLAAKTAYGVADWRPEWCLGQLRLPGCRADLGFPDLTIPEAAGKGAMRGGEHSLPTIHDVIELTIRCGRLTNAAIRPVGIAINTKAFDEAQARACLAGIAKEHDLPVTDPVRFGVAGIADRLEAQFALKAPRRASRSAGR